MVKDWKLIDVYKLLYLDKFKPHHIINFVNKFNSYDNLIETIGHSSNKLDFDYNNVILEKIFKIIDDCDDQKIQIITYWDTNYPELLRQIQSPPLILYKEGTCDLNHNKKISIVGTRHNTYYGKMIVEKFIPEFVSRNIQIVSGLAAGIDSITHKEVLKHKGHTIAVVASGLRKISPSYSIKLSKEIIENGGAVISEYPPNESAQIGYFPQRNRIISGLSQATLVIESAEKGGSLITARFAFEQGREVYAIPGNINYERSSGCNNLIKNNIAKLCSSPMDILQDFGWNDNQIIPNKQNFEFESEIERNVFETLGYDPVNIDYLIDKLEIDVATIMVNLLNLEIKGLIKQLPGKQFIRI